MMGELKRSTDLQAEAKRATERAIEFASIRCKCTHHLSAHKQVDGLCVQCPCNSFEVIP